MENNRQLTYIGFFIFLSMGFFFLRDSTWGGSAALHTVMEVAATLLSAFVGMLGLVRFYSRKSNLFLFIGVCFLGTAALDFYHALVTSQWFATIMPSPPTALVPWSWLASRMFLSVFLWLSFLAWQREERLGEIGRINEGWLYALSGLATLFSFLFFAFMPLPRAYYPGFLFHRPQEFIPALFFLLALLGYWQARLWQTEDFEHWLMLALITSLVSQVMFMSFSGKVYDAMFDAAHLLKKAAYIFVLTGLAFSLHRLLKRSDENARTALQLKESLEAILKQMVGMAVHLSNNTAQLNAATSKMAMGAESQVQQVVRTSSSMEEMAASIQEVSRLAINTSDTANTASKMAKDGLQKVKKTVGRIGVANDSIRKLNERVEKVGKVVQLIGEIAAQTNILALNAAIEAARAGEHGRGFDVVAREIRILAQKTADSTSEIAMIIGEIQDETRQAAGNMEESTVQASEAGHSLDEIVEGIVSTTDMVKVISSTATEQAKTSEEIADAIQRIAEVNKQTAQTSREVARAIQELALLADSLKDITNKFKG